VKVTREKTENSQAFLNIEMEPPEVEEYLKKSYNRLVKKANIPGFRKGKAPREILEQYIGKESLLEDALNTLIPQAYERAIEEQQIEAFARPSIEIVQTDPVIFKATVPLKPTVKLDDYHNIQVAEEPVEVTDDDVNAVIEQLRYQHANWEPVERPVEFEDLVVLDVESKIEGEPFLNEKGAQYQVLRNAPFPVPGFAEQLVGMKVGEDKEFKLQFPSDYPRSELAGKEPWFMVRVTEVKRQVLPELNDEFVREVSADLKDLDMLREKVSEDLRLRAEERARIDFEERVIDAVVDLAEVEFPPILIELEIAQLLDEQSRRLQMGGRGMEEYLRSINKTEEELREELRPVATKRITRSLVLEKIAEEEKVEVTESEVDTEIENMVKRVAENKDRLQESLNTPQARESVRQMLITRKTLQRLLEIARGSKEGEKKNGSPE